MFDLINQAFGLMGNIGVFIAFILAIAFFITTCFNPAIRSVFYIIPTTETK